jgi:hypothetical protein
MTAVLQGDGRRWRRLATLVVSVATCSSSLLAACGTPEYRFVVNQQEKNSFKLPSNWEVEDVTGAAREGRPAGFAAGTRSLWDVRFTGPEASRPPATQLGQPVENDRLEGEVRAFALSFGDNDALSPGDLRQLVFGFDPLNPSGELQNSVELVAYQPLTVGDGMVGQRVVANVNTAASTGGPARWVTIDASMLLNPAEQKAYWLRMQCSGPCYLQFRQAADEIAKSWSVTR